MDGWLEGIVGDLEYGFWDLGEVDWEGQCLGVADLG